MQHCCLVVAWGARPRWTLQKRKKVKVWLKTKGLSNKSATKNLQIKFRSTSVRTLSLKFISLQRNERNSGVSRVWQAWHMPLAPLLRGRKNCIANVIYSFLNLCLAPHATIKQQCCINTAPSCNARGVAPAPSIIVIWPGLRSRRKNIRLCKISDSYVQYLYFPWKAMYFPCCCVSGKMILIRIWLWRA